MVAVVPGAVLAEGPGGVRISGDLEHPLDRLHPDPRCDLAGLVAAHAVADDRDVVFGQEQQRVLVVIALAADVGRASELEAHCASLADPPRPSAWSFASPCRIAPKICGSYIFPKRGGHPCPGSQARAAITSGALRRSSARRRSTKTSSATQTRSEQRPSSASAIGSSRKRIAKWSARWPPSSRLRRGL